MPASGAYRVIARVTDAAGNSRDSAFASVTIDTVAPTGNITAPTGNPFIRQAISVTSNSADTGGSGVQSVTFQYSPSRRGHLDDHRYRHGRSRSLEHDAAWPTAPMTCEPSPRTTPVTRFTSPIVHGEGRQHRAGHRRGERHWHGRDERLVHEQRHRHVADRRPMRTRSSPQRRCGSTSITTDQTGQVVTCSATDNAGNTSSSSVTIKRDATIPTCGDAELVGHDDQRRQGPDRDRYRRHVRRRLDHLPVLPGDELHARAP